MIVKKAYNMAEMMKIPVLGIVEKLQLCQMSGLRNSDQDLW